MVVTTESGAYGQSWDPSNSQIHRHCPGGGRLFSSRNPILNGGQVCSFLPPSSPNIGQWPSPPSPSSPPPPPPFLRLFCPLGVRGCRLPLHFLRAGLHLDTGSSWEHAHGVFHLNIGIAENEVSSGQAFLMYGWPQSAQKHWWFELAAGAV